MSGRSRIFSPNKSFRHKAHLINGYAGSGHNHEAFVNNPDKRVDQRKLANNC